MTDLHDNAVLILDRSSGEFRDRTDDLTRCERLPDGRFEIVFRNRVKIWTYPPDRLRFLRRTTSFPLRPDARVEVDGVVWRRATEIVAFFDGAEEWWRIVRPGRYHTYPRSRVRVVPSAARDPGASMTLRYFQEVVSRLPGNDPLRRSYEGLADFVHPHSVLGRYLSGASIVTQAPGAVPVFPFRSNISQRRAVELGLTHAVSVIEGPPGTGKTETILNLIATVVGGGNASIGVVSHANAAVENVQGKLDDLGVGFVCADLGNREHRQAFFADQEERNARVTAFLRSAPHDRPPPDRLAELGDRMRRLQEDERRRADLCAQLDAHRLESRHFVRHLGLEELPDLERLPLLRRSSDRVLDYLAESGMEMDGARPGLLRRIRQYFRYGSLRGVDPNATAVVLRLQQAYYDKRIGELEHELAEVEDGLRRADLDGLVAEHRALSVQAFGAALRERYGSSGRPAFTSTDYRQGTNFAGFLREHPVILSTCHSLRHGLDDGRLLDYLVIDEASQVDPLTAVPALSCCRNVIVVGDLRQLRPIPREAADEMDPPDPSFDCREHSILSSLIALYGDHLPRTLLREHYRSDPAIIGFCNKAFYGGDLIPFPAGGSAKPMTVVRTVEGNHMRQFTGGGRFNRREVDTTIEEILPELYAEFGSEDIGVITPYRRQVDAFVDALLDRIETDTVHKYQGRQKPAMVLMTVLDETRQGRTGLPFVDDPQKINVAVSRAISRFVLVTNHGLMPRSRHVRDLVDYIRYRNPGEEVVESAVVSMFDLLYRDYNERLRPLAARLRKEMAFASEDIVWTVLHDLLAEERYAHLTVRSQILVRNLLADLNRLTEPQAAYVGNRASVDFVVYNRVSNRPLLAIEVDGFAFHANKPEQLGRDRLKNEILQTYRMPLLRLPTTGSLEERRIRQALDDAEAHDEYATDQ